MSQTKRQENQLGLFDPSFGTSPHKLVRRGDPDTSVEAAHSVDITALERLVYACIERSGPEGCISDEVRSKFVGFPYSSVTARYRALLDKGLIVDTGRRRPGTSGCSQRVMVASSRIITAPSMPPCAASAALVGERAEAI